MAFSDTKGEHGTNGSSAGRDTKGRKNGGQEAVPDPKALKKAMPELVQMYERAQDVKEKLSKKVKAVAKECGFNADAVRAAMKAKAGEKEDLELATRKAEQLVLAFEALAA